MDERTKNINYVFIKEDYFIKNSKFTKMLDPGNEKKQSKRGYLFIELEYENNKIYVPLRNNLGPENRPFGKIGFQVPSSERPDAGLDYRYILIVNDNSFIEQVETQKIPNSQYNIIFNNYETICNEVISYIEKFVKVAIKNRIDKEALFRESSLINFTKELKIDEKRLEKETTSSQKAKNLS